MNPNTVKIAAQPIIWSNDDFHDLGGRTPLETCLAEMKEAGYEGTELGHKFPKNASVLREVLTKFGLKLASGWHSSTLAERTFDQERADYLKHLEFLKAMGCDVVIVAECSKRVYHDPKLSLSWDYERDPFTADEWKNVFTGLEEFSKIAEGCGMKLAYHHHMGTVIQGEPQIERLLSATRLLTLVGDTGHLACAGVDPIRFFSKHVSRISHVHLKNVRPAVVDRVRQQRLTFERAVKDGVFTVPGDAGIDYAPIFKTLEAANYRGWMVVEAEQDPEKANPLEYVSRARQYIRKLADV